MALTRRERLRAATKKELIEAARRLLSEEGLEAITLRAIARDLGMTPPSIYHYFSNLEDLISHMVSGIYADVTDHVQAAARSHERPNESLFASARAFRSWAMDNPREYALIFGTPIPGFDVYEDTATSASGRRFGETFLRLFLQLLESDALPVVPDSEIDPALRDQLESYRRNLGVDDLPLGVLFAMVKCWERLQGCVSLEAFGHFRFVLQDAEPLFEDMLNEISRLWGIAYVPPEP